MSNLSIKFIQGLQKLGLSYNDVKTWQYCGGKSWSDGEHQLLSKHEIYFMKCYPSIPFPNQVKQCICETGLIHNCYIRKDNNSPIESILIVGQCCVEKFIDSGIKKVCEKCNKTHNNRKYNLCNDCKKIQIQREKDEAFIEREKEKERQKYLRRYYYDIPYAISNDSEYKCDLYNNKCKWDSELKLWYATTSPSDRFVRFNKKYYVDDILDFIEKRENKHIEYFDIEYANREQAKKDGLKFDWDVKKWYKQY